MILPWKTSPANFKERLRIAEITNDLRLLMMTVRRARNMGLYVDVKIGMDGAMAEVWRTHDGFTTVLDTDRAQHLETVRT